MTNYINCLHDIKVLHTRLQFKFQLQWKILTEDMANEITKEYQLIAAENNRKGENNNRKSVNLDLFW